MSFKDSDENQAIVTIFSEDITEMGLYEFDLMETDRISQLTYTQHVILNVTGCFNVADQDRQSVTSLNYTMG